MFAYSVFFLLRKVCSDRLPIQKMDMWFLLVLNSRLVFCKKNGSSCSIDFNYS